MDVKLSSADSPWSRYRKKRLSENAAAVAAAELRADGAIKPRVLARNSQAPAAAAGAGARQRKTEVGWSALLSDDRSSSPRRHKRNVHLRRRRRRPTSDVPYVWPLSRSLARDVVITSCVRALCDVAAARRSSPLRHLLPVNDRSQAGNHGLSLIHI